MYRGRNFFMPKDIRPTQNIAREALFNLLGHDLSGFSFLDLFAGSGSVGLEALSRGASQVIFVEKEEKHSEIIEENVRRLRIDHTKREVNIEILCKDAFAAIKDLAARGRVFDIIFIDPPYERELAKKTLKHLEAHVIVHPNSTVIFQHEKQEILPEIAGRFSLYRQKKYGQSYFSIYNINKNTG